MKTLFMEKTKISVGQTVAEIQKILGEYGACAVMTEYKNKEVIAVCFKVIFLDRDMPFRLPCRWECIYKNFVDRRASNRDKPSHRADIDIPQSKMVAWRQILRWVEAQMALVETDMVKVHEVFLPYMQVGINKQGESITLADKFSDPQFKLLESK